MKKTGKRISNKDFLITVLPLLIIVAALAIAVTAVAESYRTFITKYLGQSFSRIVDTSAGEQADTAYFKSGFGSVEELQSYTAELCERAEGEGAVLLKNDGALPLTDEKNISLFSLSAYDFIYGGGGAGAIDPAGAPTLKEAMEREGFRVNEVLWDFYGRAGAGYGRKPNAAIDVPDVIGEIPVSLYPDDVLASLAAYNDAAVVVISRLTAEAKDCVTATDETGGHFLELTFEERALIELIDRNFAKCIVLLNTAGPIELGWIDEYAAIKGCLWVGYVGETGILAIPKLLRGKINPSGRLTDTYAYDLEKDPAFADLHVGAYVADRDFPNRKGRYRVYGEGIYVGYRYYETRYEDVVSGRDASGRFDYAAAVQFPFGHGLSYTSFACENAAFARKGETVEMTADVKNIGFAAGRETVQCYIQAPFTDYDRAHGIERPAVALCGFVKTRLLTPGQSERIKITVPLTRLRVFDANGAGGYILEKGDYYFTLSRDAHDAVQKITAAKSGKATENDDTWRFRVAETDAETYNVGADGAPIEPLFADADLRSYDAGYRYLSRTDWEGTWPRRYKDGKWAAPAALIDAVLDDPYRAEEVTAMPATEAANGMSLITMKGAAYDDAHWEQLLDNLSADEMVRLTSLAGWGTAALTSVNKPETAEKDGPAGLTASVSGGRTGRGYVCAAVLAASWDAELAEEIGRAVGEEGLAYGVSGWYAPAVNIHRSPFGGRNFEYYSEDPLLGGAIGAHMVRGAQSKGMYTYVKHFALNDLENLRYGVSTFCNEQAMREIYFKPFEMTVRVGGAKGIMVAFNSLGPIWCGAHKALITDVLRGEWGFRGTVITDTTMYTDYTYYDAALYAGTDLQLNNVEGKYTLPGAANNAHYVTLLRRAAHNVLYTVVGSHAMNGISQKSKIVMAMPLWERILIAADVVAAIFVLGGGTLTVIRVRYAKKHPERYLS